MAESYNDDDDLNRLKQWWKENGVALVLGAGVGLAAIMGWQWWQAHTEAQALEAAGLYEQLESKLRQGSAGEAAQELAQRLKTEYSGSPYATQAALALARSGVEREDYNAAIEQLKWVVSYTDQEAMRHIARVRQARLLWAQDKVDAALTLLRQDHPPTFTPLYAELEGDIHAETGQTEAAREAYSKALQGLALDDDRNPLLRKLQEVGGMPEVSAPAGETS